MKPKRPFTVTLLAFLVLSLVVVHFTRFAAVVRQWEFLHRLPLAVSPLYLGATGLIWSFAGLVPFWGLWCGKRRTPRAIKIFLGLYALYHWLEQTLVMNNPLRQTNWSFSIIITILVLTAPFWILSRPTARTFFGDKHE